MAHSIVLPEAFARAVDTLRTIRVRKEIVVEELPAPQKLAPYATSLGGRVLPDASNGLETEDDATGRLILLHDPDGQTGWKGETRLVTYVTAEMEPDLAADPLLPAVGWSWLVDALEDYDAGYTALAGTVTQTMSTRMGDLAGPPTMADIEIRASWTPLDDDLEGHVLAWVALLASLAGLPPPGITALPARRSTAGLPDP